MGFLESLIDNIDGFLSELVAELLNLCYMIISKNFDFNQEGIASLNIREDLAIETSLIILSNINYAISKREDLMYLKKLIF